MGGEQPTNIPGLDDLDVSMCNVLLCGKNLVLGSFIDIAILIESGMNIQYRY